MHRFDLSSTVKPAVLLHTGPGLPDKWCQCAIVFLSVHTTHTATLKCRCAKSLRFFYISQNMYSIQKPGPRDFAIVSMRDKFNLVEVGDNIEQNKCSLVVAAKLISKKKKFCFRDF